MSRNRTISKKIYGVERQIFLALFALLIMSISFYIYFVGKSIVNVVVREEVEFSIADINSHLSELESEYLAKKDAMTLSFAQAKGFHLVSERSFVNRGTLVGKSLSVNNEI